MQWIKQCLAISLLAVVLTSCSSQNPVAPTPLSDDNAKKETQAQSFQYQGSDFVASVYYRKADPLTGFPEMTQILVRKYYGPLTSRTVQASVMSGYTSNVPPSPVVLKSAYNSTMGWILMGFDADGQLVYCKQTPSFAGGDTLFCYYIYSMTATGSKITKY